ncbi:hypothetical protein KJ969_02475 [Patescibacteria group bacterium]|nr:hypothetical protein [Patescibacteria group bacterium]MBU1921691.1 hypothetical protein [Patescibacteria group bacterium]
MKYMVIAIFFAAITWTGFAQAKAYENPRIGILFGASHSVHKQVKLHYKLTLPNLAAEKFASGSLVGIQWFAHPAFNLQILFGGTHQPGDNTWKISLRPTFIIKKFFIFCLFNYNVNFYNLFHFIQAGHPLTDYFGLSLASEGITKFKDIEASWVTVGPSLDINFGKHVTINAINMIGVEKGRQYYVFRMYLVLKF